MMLAVHEHRVCTLAHRMGLRLLRVNDDETQPPRYRLVEPHSMTPVLPGGTVSADLEELEDWLLLPWE
jgi:hypothetical protein